MNPQVKTIVSHSITGMAFALAAISFAANHSVDLYALYDQLNKLVAQAVQFGTAVIALWNMWKAFQRTEPENRITELAADPKALKVAESMPATPQVQALADALKR